MNEPLTLLIDGPNVAIGCYYAYSTMSDTTGEDISVIYGFFRSLMSAMRSFKPTTVIVCWDKGSPAYRQKLFPSYKANRVKDEEVKELFSEWGQIVTIREALSSFCGVLNVDADGMEADDLLYHATRIIDQPCVVMSRDKDLLQCLTPDERVRVYDTHTRATISWQDFEHRMGFPPHQFVDYKVLVGDKSDNLPGVAGIGDKMARAILKQYGTAEAGLYAAHYCKWEGPTLARTRLRRARFDYLELTRQVVDLSYNQFGAGDVIREAIEALQPYDEMACMQFMLAHSFVDLVNAHKSVFNRLGAPPLLTTGEEQSTVSLSIIDPRNST